MRHRNFIGYAAHMVGVSGLNSFSYVLKNFNGAILYFCGEEEEALYVYLLEDNIRKGMKIAFVVKHFQENS